MYEQHDEKGRLVSRQARERLGGLDGRKPCRKVFTDMIVCWDGRLALCNYDWEGRRDIGNVSEMTLQEAWDSQGYEEVRRMHLCGRHGDGICAQCHHWKIDYAEGGLIGTSYRS